MQQGSEAWRESRVGVCTASRFSDVMATIKSGESALRYNYKAELVAERLAGKPAESYTNAAMAWGIDHEDEARAIYKAITGNKVTQTGLVKHPNLEAGASTDGLVNDDGNLEIKCRLH